MLYALYDDALYYDAMCIGLKGVVVVIAAIVALVYCVLWCIIVYAGFSGITLVCGDIQAGV